MQHLLARPSFYIGGILGMLLFFISLGVELLSQNETVVFIGTRFVEITTFPVTFLLGSADQTIVDFVSFVWVFFLWGFITAVTVHALRKW